MYPTCLLNREKPRNYASSKHPSINAREAENTKIKFCSRLSLLNNSFRGKLLHDVNRARDRRDTVRAAEPENGKVVFAEIDKGALASSNIAALDAALFPQKVSLSHDRAKFQSFPAERTHVPFAMSPRDWCSSDQEQESLGSGAPSPGAAEEESPASPSLLSRGAAVTGAAPTPRRPSLPRPRRTWEPRRRQAKWWCRSRGDGCRTHGTPPSTTTSPPHTHPSPALTAPASLLPPTPGPGPLHWPSPASPRACRRLLSAAAASEPASEQTPRRGARASGSWRWCVCGGGGR